MMMAIVLIMSGVASYLLGGVNGAILASKLFHHEDIRQFGSKNPGFTNYKRVYGNGIVTWLVLVFDVAKTALPVFLTAWVMEANFGLWQFGAQFSGLCAMLGHCFPVWYKFKGGKGFLAGFATIWFVDWRMALVAVGVFFIVLFTSKYMSLASCSAALVCPIVLAFLNPQSIWVELLAIAAAALVILRHHENFAKLMKGTESKFSLSSKKS